MTAPINPSPRAEWSNFVSLSPAPPTLALLFYFDEYTRNCLLSYFTSISHSCPSLSPRNSLFLDIFSLNQRHLMNVCYFWLFSYLNLTATSHKEKRNVRGSRQKDRSMRQSLFFESNIALSLLHLACPSSYFTLPLFSYTQVDKVFFVQRWSFNVLEIASSLLNLAFLFFYCSSYFFFYCSSLSHIVFLPSQ